jgi:hypothetical protein
MFLWAILLAFHPASKHPQRVTKYIQWEHEFDNAFNATEFSVKLSDVSKFAKRTNLSINVSCFDNGSIAPLEVTKEERENHFELLYYKTHYCWIKDVGRLVRSKITKRTEKRFVKCV